MTVQTTFAASGNPWAYLNPDDMKQYRKQRQVTPKGKFQTQRPMTYPLGIGTEENPRGDGTVYTYWGDILGKMDGTNFIICPVGKAVYLAVQVRQWFIRRDRRISSQAFNHSGRIYVKVLDATS